METWSFSKIKSLLFQVSLSLSDRTEFNAFSIRETLTSKALLVD